MPGQRSERMMSLSSRVGARMAKRLARVEDLFARAPLETAQGVINFDQLFDELDKCGHQWGAEFCDCPKCNEMREQLRPLILQAVQPEGGQ